MATIRPQATMWAATLLLKIALKSEKFAERIMHTRRLSTLILGFWLGLTVAMFFVATQNFRNVNRLLSAPVGDAAQSLQRLGPESSRSLLRYQAAELNRFYFDWYALAQLVLALIFSLVFFAASPGRFALIMCGLLIAITGVQKVFLVPEIASLSRMLDFVPAGLEPGIRNRLNSYHAVFGAGEVAKVGALMVVAVRLLMRTGQRSVRRRDPAKVEEHVDNG